MNSVFAESVFSEDLKFVLACHFIHCVGGISVSLILYMLCIFNYSASYLKVCDFLLSLKEVLGLATCTATNSNVLSSLYSSLAALKIGLIISSIFCVSCDVSVSSGETEQSESTFVHSAVETK